MGYRYGCNSAAHAPELQHAIWFPQRQPQPSDAQNFVIQISRWPFGGGLWLADENGTVLLEGQSGHVLESHPPPQPTPTPNRTIPRRRSRRQRPRSWRRRRREKRLKRPEPMKLLRWKRRRKRRRPHCMRDHAVVAARSRSCYCTAGFQVV